MIEHSPVAPYAVARGLTGTDLKQSLAAGLRDFMAHPLYGLFFASFYVLGGFLMVYGLSQVGQGWWTIPAMAGFPLIAPFSAVGLYEVSRRREAGLPLSWGAVLGALRGRGGDEQVVMMGGLVFIAFSFWMGLAHGVYAIFIGELGVGHDVARLLAEPSVIAMLIVGSLLGGLFALALFSITVMSLPMLVDRDVDFITAIIVSLGVMRCNKGIMIGWALIIAVLLGLSLIPAFAGLFIALPVLGHATWHLYRRAVVS